MEYVTIREASAITGASKRAITLHIVEGKLPAEKFGGQWAIARSDLHLIVVRPRGNPNWVQMSQEVQ